MISQVETLAFNQETWCYHGVQWRYNVIYFGYDGLWSYSQWEFQDPKMEVLYHIRSYFVGIFPYIGHWYRDGSRPMIHTISAMDDSYFGVHQARFFTSARVLWSNVLPSGNSLQLKINMGMDQYLWKYHIFRGLFTSILSQLWLDVNKKGVMWAGPPTWRIMPTKCGCPAGW